MSGTSEVPENAGIADSKSPITPRGRKLIQGRLPFMTVDNKTPIKPKLENKKLVGVEEENGKASPISVEPKKKKSASPEEETDKLPMMIELTDSNSVNDISIIEEDEKESEMNTSSASQEGSESAVKETTPIRSGRKKKIVEKTNEKEEREKKRAEKERVKKEKEEEKKRKEEEKEAEKRKKEEEKKRKEEEKEAEKKKKEEEKRKKEEEKEEQKKKKEEEKEEEKKKKEEEKRKKEEEKENEKKKKEEEDKKKKERLSQVFTSFFTQKKTTSAKNSDQPETNPLAFPPFQIKENMKMAPSLRSLFDDERKKILDESIHQYLPKSKLYIQRLQFSKGAKWGPTWAITKDTENDIEIIDEDDASLNKEDVILSIEPSDNAVVRRMKAKMFKFHENRRPAYWGTWRKTSQVIGPRRPHGKEPIFDYEVDSDDEWEEEVEPGESLTDSEGEGEEKEPADDYEVDNEFLVPHGYLSDEEGEKEEDEQPLSPSAAKEMLKIKGEQFERELKEKTCHIKPSLIGCCWSQQEEKEPQLFKVLNRYSAVVLRTITPIVLSNNSELTCDNGESPLVDGSASVKKTVNESDIPSLIQILHGANCSKVCIVREFQAYLERNHAERPDADHMRSKAQIVAKIGEIASWMKCTEAGSMNGRTCWMVNVATLDRYHLSALSAQNTWQFSTEKKKRGRKIDESKTAGDDATPSPKTARISLIKKFIQPSSPLSSTTPENVVQISSHSPLSAKPSVSEETTSTTTTSTATAANTATTKARKRVALISLSSSATKRPRNEAMASPLTSLLKKMAESKSSKNEFEKEAQDTKKSEEKEHDCFTID